MAKMKLHKYRFKSNAINFTNYAIFTLTAILVLITAHAKSAQYNNDNANNLDDDYITINKPNIDDNNENNNNNLITAIPTTATSPAVATTITAAATASLTTITTTDIPAVTTTSPASTASSAPTSISAAAASSINLENVANTANIIKHLESANNNFNQNAHNYIYHHQHQHQPKMQRSYHLQQQQHSNKQIHHHSQQQQEHQQHHQHHSNMLSYSNEQTEDIDMNNTYYTYAADFIADKRPYRSKFTIEKLLHTKFPKKISHDIDMDPCKAGGFMGDIALPDIGYEDDDMPIVARTLIDWEAMQADEPATSNAHEDKGAPLRFNTTFQQELELLKQQVYHEGLQVEEEGLTHIIRKKTKLPNSNSELNNERHRNDATLSANEPVKPTGYSMHNDYLMKNLKNDVISSQHPQTEYFEPKISLHEKPVSVVVDDVLTTTGGINAGNDHDGSSGDFTDAAATGDSVAADIDAADTSGNRNTLFQQRWQKKRMNSGNDDSINTKGSITMDANGKFEPISLHHHLQQYHQHHHHHYPHHHDAHHHHQQQQHYYGKHKISDDLSETEKLNKSTTGLGNRNVDQRKIQSNTKDIEDDSGNNFVGERKVIILPTSLPTQRSTMANVYSNANGMKLDDVDFMHGTTMVRRRHRRGRKNRRSSELRSEYNAKLQRLKEELNRPIRTAQDFQMAPITNLYRSIDGKSNWKKFPSDSMHHHQQQQQEQQEEQQQAFKTANNLNYSSEMNDELDVLTKRKFTMDAITAEMQSTSLESEIQNAENLKHLEHHHRMARAVTAKKERIWDYGVIPYEIDGNFSGLHKALFKQAMRHWENSTCIKFVERDPEIHPNYIVFTVRSCGCCSFVGKRGNGPQAISIGRNCDKFGIVVHELGHVVGFWHEHTRPDREKHVVIEHNNIMKGQDYNFNKLTPDEVDSLGMAYDYDSIMHYARNTFSKGTYLDTILPIEVKGKKRPEIGQRLRLSIGDIAQANLLYKCPKCGRTFQENTGIFASPSYYTAGALSNESLHCEWRITATHGERIVIRLENLNILKSNNCQTDYLEIRDGYYFKSPLIGRFCGKVSSEVITTESSRMLLTYVNTHRSEGYRGFKAEYEVICGGELSVDDAEGRLESPNYPLDYLPNKECVWKITVPKGYQVALKFQSFEVENHDSCVYDYVEVRDGPTQNAPLIGVFCGYKPPPNMKSSGNSMFVKFMSDTSVQKAGFSAIFMKEVDECETQNHGCEHGCMNTLGGYECSCRIGYELHSDKKHCEDACGGVIEYPNGTITSPSFPDMYPVLKECIWEIIAPPKHKISLNFTHFDLEGTTHQQSDCGYDSVTIYSKLSENRLKRIGTYCGGAIPPTSTSEGNALRVEFHSDKSIQSSGFAAVFFTDIDECSKDNGGCQHECHNVIGSFMCSCHNGYSLHENGQDCKEGECKHEISAPFGTIYSPNFPDPYPPNADCVWHFSTTPGHRIKLIFNEFNVESHQECAYDNVAIYDGESESSSILGRFCGDKIPYPISSSTNQLYMVLKTDKNKQLNGFTAMHSTSCGGYLRATNQIQQFYSHARFGNHNYNENMDCEWTIQAPASSNVQLLFLTFDIESSENCTYDYVQVFSGMEDTSGPMYGQYCGNTLPQDIISLTDSLLVRFKTDNTITMKGFSASYVAVDPFRSSDEDINSYSSEMVTPFPGSLKSIYKQDETHESDDYSDFSENHLIINNPYRSRNRYQNRF